MHSLKTTRIPELDGLRAFAVMAVVFYHIIDCSEVIPNISPSAHKAIALFGVGGVNIFFVISGFIITSLLIREQDITGKVSLSFFYQRRFFRIIPPFAVYLFVIFILSQVHYIHVKSIYLLWSALFLGNLGLFGPISPENWFVGHTWSLSVEEQYYLVLPIVMIVILRFRVKPISILLIFLFLICLIANKLAKEGADHINPILIHLTFLNSFKFIITGVLIALHKSKVERLVKNTYAILPIGLMAIILLIPFTSFPTFISPFLSAVEAVSFGLFVLWFVENPEKCAILRWRWIQWIGACSYSIYLWQQLFTGSADDYNGWSIAQSPLAIVAIFCCSALSYYFIELPTIQLGRSFSAKKSVEDPAIIKN